MRMRRELRNTGEEKQEMIKDAGVDLTLDELNAVNGGQMLSLNYVYAFCTACPKCHKKIEYDFQYQYDNHVNSCEGRRK